LLLEVRSLGYVTAFAGVSLPNPASVGLHEALGFTPVGVYRDVGFKLGAWRDVGWWQLQLREPPAAPAEPREWSPSDCHEL
jgi:phosphinothricin acetyltransferase